MEAQRLLIAESNEDIRLALARELQSFHYVRCCGTGAEALEILRREQPDILVLNMLLPEIDGLTLLETIASEGIRPMVLALTTYWSDYLDASAGHLGISYALMKPFSLESIIGRILDMKQYLKTLPPKPTPETLTAQLLESISVHPGIPHYTFVTQALLLSVTSAEMPQCKALYREIAKNHHTTFDTVERGIRRILENAWSQEDWQAYFPGSARRPSNKVFLQKMSAVLRQAMEDAGL